MGDRALVIFTDGESDFSPVVYLHYGGARIPRLLRDALPRLRQDNTDYSAARFCGLCHERSTKRNTGLGIFNSPAPRAGVPGKARGPEAYADVLAQIKDPEFSHGDAGVFLVNVKTWRVECFNGYGFREEGALVDAEPVMELQLDAAAVPD